MSIKFLSVLAGAAIFSAALNLHATTPTAQNMLANDTSASLVRSAAARWPRWSRRTQPLKSRTMITKAIASAP